MHLLNQPVTSIMFQELLHGRLKGTGKHISIATSYVVTITAKY